MCDFCVFGRLHMCVCWWGGGGGQAGRIPARSVFQTPEKLSEAAVAADDRRRPAPPNGEASVPAPDL